MQAAAEELAVWGSAVAVVLQTVAAAVEPAVQETAVGEPAVWGTAVVEPAVWGTAVGQAVGQLAVWGTVAGEAVVQKPAAVVELAVWGSEVYQPAAVWEIGAAVGDFEAVVELVHAVAAEEIVVEVAVVEAVGRVVAVEIADWSVVQVSLGSYFCPVHFAETRLVSDCL